MDSIFKNMDHLQIYRFSRKVPFVSRLPKLTLKQLVALEKSIVSAYLKFHWDSHWILTGQVIIVFKSLKASERKA